jgi:hypothetical protein
VRFRWSRSGLSGCALSPELGMGRSNAPVAQVGEMPILSQNSRGVHIWK